MLVKFKAAILANRHWCGEDAQAIAVGLKIMSSYEAQYRGQVEMMRREEKEAIKKSREVSIAGNKNIH